MSKVRLNAWSQRDDIILADTVIKHIKHGSSQLNAFHEAAKILKRTRGACDFRWNSHVRKQFKNSITAAKAHRQSTKKNTHFSLNIDKNELLSSLNTILTAIRVSDAQYKKTQVLIAKYKRDLIMVNEMINQLATDNFKLKKMVMPVIETSEAEAYENRRALTTILKNFDQLVGHFSDTTDSIQTG